MNEREQLEQAIHALEAQRATLGDSVIEPMIAAAREKLATLEQAEEDHPVLRGERRLVTVMFADISGFTTLAETNDPEAVRDLMNACFNHLVPVIETYGGTVDKFIGDEIMALFGAPVTHENDAERALRAALGMLEALQLFNVQRSTRLSLHFGINTGLVIAGGIGTRGRQEYSVMGDAVNIASRLEELSAPGEILLGPDTHRMTAPLFEFESLDPVQVKGKAEPVPVYRLLAAKRMAGKVRGIAGLESPLVGRQAQLDALKESMRRLHAGQGGIVTLVGEAGLGKSRLMAEVRKDALTGQLEWIEGRCLSYGTSIAYLLWLDVLRALLEVKADDPPFTVRDALWEYLVDLCPTEARTLFVYLARLLSLPLTAHEEAVLHTSEGLKKGTFHAVERILVETARRAPLVVVCEDLHWADPSSLELLEHLLPRVRHVPLLFVCVLRPEKDHGCWHIRNAAAEHYGAQHVDVLLAPLSEGESETLVDHLLYVEDLPRPLKKRILNRAEGNPFYVEEIIRSLMDSDAIRREEDSGRWYATRDITDIDIPDTLHGVLMARIDRLQDETKRVLQLAAVIGRIFLYRVLATIAEEERTLDDHLLTLQHEEMIRERAQVPELEYIFKHQLTQQAAYNGLLRSERRVFHRQVAQALERLFPDRIEEMVGLLAHHWERAQESEHAIAYLLRAGDQARLAYAHAEAIQFYRRALALLKEEQAYDEAARTLMRLGLTYHNALDFPCAREAYQEGFALWRKAEENQPRTLPAPPHPFRIQGGEPPTLDPTMAEDIASATLIEQIFSGLLSLTPRMDVVPDVAHSWEVLEDGRRYIFHLRDDVRWSDGVPTTAHDFVYAWKRVLDPATGSPNAQLLYDIRDARDVHHGRKGPDEVGIHAPDERTLIVELEEPAGYFLSLVAQCATFPVPRHVVQAHGHAWADPRHIVTNGAFLLESWQPNASMTLARDPGYHGRSQGNVERVERRVRPGDAESLLQLYEENTLDTIGLQVDDVGQIPDEYAEEYVCSPLLWTEYAGFNVSLPPFDDLRARQAFVLAVDRERLAKEILQDRVAPATGGFLPLGMPGHARGSGLPYDPRQARRLLAEAGYPGGRGFPVVKALMHRARRIHSEYLHEQWLENLGIRVEWQEMAWSELVERLRTDPPHVFLMGWVADYPDPDNFLRVGFWRERVKWANESYDVLVEQAKRVADQERRMRLYSQADRILTQDAAILPLTYGRRHTLIKPWVKVPVSSFGRTWLWKDVLIEPH